MNQEIFLARRKEFCQKLGKGMAVLFSAPHQKRNSDVHFEFRTCSYFYYLTGVREENAAAIFLPNSDKPYRLFVMPKDAEREMWEGKRIGVDGAKSIFMADETYPIESLEAELRNLLGKSEVLYHCLGQYAEQDDMIFRLVKDHHPNARKGDKKFSGVLKAQDLIAPARKIKTADELEVIRKNCRNSALAHRKAMEFTRPGMFEYQVEAEIEYWFRHGGADDLAYASIVAGGNNATVLHYKTNRDQLKDGTMLLIDAGGEMDLYASDITRTYPVNGKFSKAQREIYEIVLRAQKTAIEMVAPGVTYDEIHKATTEMLVDGLVHIGLLHGPVSEIMKDKKNYVLFYPHGTGHWIGLDVHDAGDYYGSDGSPIPLSPGNMITIEPGIYITDDRMDVPPEYRGIGIRIEDDILVTASGRENLTIDAPKEISDIEAIVGTSKRT